MSLSQPNLNGIKNKIVLITGASSGIGKTVAQYMLQHGALVIVNSRNREHLNAAVQDLNRYSSKVFGIQAHIGRQDEIDTMIGQIKAEWGKIDILINNAGIAKFSPILEMSEMDWEKMVETNLKGVFLCTKAVLPDMMENRAGHIMTITSVAAIKVFQNCAVYSASKAGALAFMNVLREEVRQFRIHVTSIIAGATDTPLWESIKGDFHREKMMKVDSIAQAVLAAIQNPDGMVEEVRIRPVGGDL